MAETKKPSLPAIDYHEYKTALTTLTPNSLTSAVPVPYNELDTGVLHKRHFLNLSVTISIKNTGTAAATNTLALTPYNVLGYLESLQYSTNNDKNFFSLDGYHAYHIGQAQLLKNEYISTDTSAQYFTTSQIQASIAAGATANYAASALIPVNFVGTQVAQPGAIGLAALEEAPFQVRTFSVTPTFGTISDILTAASISSNSGFTVSIASASLQIEERLIPQLIPVKGMLPSFRQNVTSIATSDQASAVNNVKIKLPYGNGEIYKRLWLFTLDSNGNPSDNIIDNLSIKYNTTGTLANNLNHYILKSENMSHYFDALPVGMNVYDFCQGDLNNSINTLGFSSFDFICNFTSAGYLDIIAERLNIYA